MKLTIDKKNNKAALIEFVLVVLASTGLVAIVFWGIGVYNSGWHLVDDHRSFALFTDLKYNNVSLKDLVIKLLHDDFVGQHRDRQLHYPYRALEAFCLELTITSTT